MIAWAIMIGMAKNPTRHGAPAPQDEPRRAGADTLAWTAIAPDQAARACSFWTEVGGQCSIPAAYGPGLSPARFSPLMRVTLRAPQPHAKAKTNAAWVVREQAQVNAANDAEVAARYGAADGGGAVVRVLKAKRMRPSVAAWGETALAA
jgi:hypothetical protein